MKRNDQDYAQNSGRFRVGVDLPGIIKKRRKEMEAAEKALKKAEKQQRKSKFNLLHTLHSLGPTD